MRKPIPVSVRFEVFKRDRFRCVYCGRTGSSSPLHVDHWNPVLLGGSDAPSNLVTACQDCNLGKSATQIHIDFEMTMLVVHSRFEHADDYDPERAFAAVQYAHQADGAAMPSIHGAARIATDYDDFEVRIGDLRGRDA